MVPKLATYIIFSACLRTRGRGRHGIPVPLVVIEPPRATAVGRLATLVNAYFYDIGLWRLLKRDGRLDSRRRRGDMKPFHAVRVGARNILIFVTLVTKQ